MNGTHKQQQHNEHNNHDSEHGNEEDDHIDCHVSQKL